jgi:rhamnogalacturonyl hydrolase YesR
MNKIKLINMITISFEKLRRYCETEGFKGYDPYDGLNSPFAKLLQFDQSRLLRLVWIQAFKKSPINLRPLFFIEKDYNPKGIALFLTGYCNLYKITKNKVYLDKVHYLAKILLSLKSKGFSGSCWGYNFPWQSRSHFVPKGYPTVVTTSFASYALIDAFECTKKTEYLDEAISSCKFILKDLKKTKRGDGHFFSYSPLRHSCVYNASLLASRLLSRVYIYFKDEKIINNAKASIEVCAAAQGENGAWKYGELSHQNWVDSFHTGFNLECISEYQKYSEDVSYSKNLEIGLQYYLKEFFYENGKAKYFDNRVYPIDIHSTAQFVVALFRMEKLNEYKKRVDVVIEWAINKMQDKLKGYFYYQISKYVSNRIPYMRWSQAWMFYALSFYILNELRNTIKSHND